MSEFGFDQNSSDWEERTSQDRLKEDNERLKNQLGFNESNSFMSERMPPELENRFLQNVMDFEEADKLPKRTMRSLFPDDFTFPTADTLSKQALHEKLSRILEILEENEIAVDLVADLPVPLVYSYLIEDALSEEIMMELPEGTIMHLDGCDGYCPECFQRPYCETSKEIWTEDDQPILEN